MSVTHFFWRFKVYFTSCLPPEQAKDKGVSLVLSDWASISAPLSSKISTTPTWPAVAAKISGVNPETENSVWRVHVRKWHELNHQKSKSKGFTWSLGLLGVYLVGHTGKADRVCTAMVRYPPFLSLCSMLAPLSSRVCTSSSWPPAQASVKAVSWLLSV